MNRRCAFLLIALLLAVQLPLLGVGAAPADLALAGLVVPDQAIIAFDPASDEATRDAIVAGRGGRTIQRLESIDARLVELPPAQSQAVALADISGEPAVRYAQPNYTYSSAASPNDPSFNQLWSLDNTGQNGGTADADIDAREAWDVTMGSAEIVVGVVDSGIDPNHPDLVANLWTAPAGWSIKGCGAGTHGYRHSEGVIDCAPIDENGHGTHVAGIIGATGNNGQGVTGVNWSVRLMALRFLGANGLGSTTSAIDVLDYAVQARQAGVNLRVLNNSYGIPSYDRALRDQLAVINANGILFVAASGNNGSDNGSAPIYPAGYSFPPDNLPNIVVVASTDRNDRLASFSNYGATTVHLGAPGVEITSTYPGGGYRTFSGTSMAAPIVTGAAALVLSAPGLRNLGVVGLRDRLLGCGDPLPALAGKTITGKRLNVDRAIRNTAGCAPVLARCLPDFSDLALDDPACPAVAALFSQGVIQGYATTPPTFGPGDPVQRAQAATFLVRALGWQGEPTGPRTFSDFGGLVRELRDAVLILANRCQEPDRPDTCIARGYGDGRFGPTNRVSYAEVVALISRAFALDPRYGWEAQPNGASPYLGVPATHSVAIRTYHHYAGAIPEPPTTAVGWDAAAPRAWVARALWQALELAP